MAKNDSFYVDYAYDCFFRHVEKYAKLSMSQKETLKRVLKVSYYPQKSFFLQTGNPSRLIGFIVKGSALAQSRIDDKYVIDKFFMEDSFIVCNISDYLMQTNADNDIVFCKSSVVLELDYYAYLNIRNNFPKINDILYQLLDEELQFYKKRMRSMQTKNARGRLEELVEDDIDILEQFKLREVAAYIGVEQETLSRLRVLHREKK